jgi:peroxiredoxin
MENNNELHGSEWVDQRLAQLSSEWTPDTNRALARLRDRRGIPTMRTRAWNWKWSIAGGTVCLCLMAFPAPREAAHYCLNCTAALWQNLSTSSKVARASLMPEYARKPAPDFILNDASGRPVQLSSFKGKIVLLNFWATWCPACEVEIPWFIDFQETYAPRGLQVLGVSLDDGGWKLVKPYIAAKRVNYPMMIGDTRALFGVEALPVSFIIDKAGRIASTHRGLVGKSDYQTEIEELLTEPQP